MVKEGCNTENHGSRAPSSMVRALRYHIPLQNSEFSSRDRRGRSYKAPAAARLFPSDYHHPYFVAPYSEFSSCIFRILETINDPKDAIGHGSEVRPLR